MCTCRTCSKHYVIIAAACVHYVNLCMYVHVYVHCVNDISFFFHFFFFSPMLSYRFIASEFSECSKSCGCGSQSRTVQCFSFFGEEQREEVDFDFCQFFADNQTLPSPLSRICNDFPCPEWRTSSFSEVSICILYL